MRIFYLGIILLGLTLSSGAQTWERYYGTTADENGVDLIVLNDGNYLALGSRKANYSVYEFFLTKTDTSGNVIWSQSFPGNNNPVSVSEDSDGFFYVASTVNSGSSISKMDGSGILLWTRVYTNPTEIATSNMVLDDSGNLVRTGDKCVVVYDKNNGDVLLRKSFGTGFFNYIHKISSGGFLLGGMEKKNVSYTLVNEYFLKTDVQYDSVWAISNSLRLSGAWINIIDDGNNFVATAWGCDAMMNNCWYSSSGIYIISYTGSLIKKISTGAGYSWLNGLAPLGNGSYIGAGGYGTSNPQFVYMNIDTTLSGSFWYYPNSRYRPEFYEGKKFIPISNGRFIGIGTTYATVGHGGKDLLLIKFDKNLVSKSNTVSGKVLDDTNKNCSGTTGLANEFIQITDQNQGFVFHTKTDASGNYSMLLSDGDYRVTHTPNALRNTNCPASKEYPVTVNSGNPNITNLNFYDTLKTNANIISGIVFNNFHSWYNPLDPPYPNAKVEIQPGNYILTTDASGRYSVQVDTGSYTITVVTDAQHTATPSVQTAQFHQYGIQDTLNNFTISPQINDIRIDLTMSGRTRPGNEICYVLTCQNLGTYVSNVKVKLKYDAQLTYNSSSMAPDSMVGTNAYWTFSTLKSGEIKSIRVYASIPFNASMSSVLYSVADISSGSYDASPSNNTSACSRMITNSYDPNLKEVSPEVVNAEQIVRQDPFTYTVYFQNTGNDTAKLVRVVDTLSSQLSYRDIEMLGSSHAYSFFMKDGIGSWTFANINLPDSNVNEVKSHGFIRFRIRPKPTVQINESIENKVNIYFDYNAPIITNKAIVNVVDFTNPLISFPDMIKVYGTTFTPVIGSNSTGSFSYLSSDTSIAKIVNGSIKVVGVGTAIITATQASTSGFLSASAAALLTTTKKSQTLSFYPNTSFKCGNQFTLYGNASSGLPVRYISTNTSVISISGNIAVAVGTGSASIIAKQDGNANYLPADSLVRTITITQNTQTIGFSAIGTKTFGVAPFVLNATCAPGLTVSFTSLNTSVVTISGNIATIVGAGSATIVAKQIGNDCYRSADSVVQTVTIIKSNQVISNGTVSTRYTTDAPFLLTASANSGLPITYTSSNTSVIQISGDTAIVKGAGSAYITASQSGNVNYNASSIYWIQNVSKVAQTIYSFDPIAAQVYGNAPLTLAAYSSSGLPIQYTSSNSSVISVSGNILSFVGVGTVTISATQSGNNTYLSKTISQSVTVSKASQTLSFSAIGTTTYCDHTITLAATSSAGLPIVYSSSNTSVLTISGNVATLVGIGTVSLTAQQAGSTLYNASSSVQTITVNQCSQTIAFSSLPLYSTHDAGFELTANSSSGLALVYKSSNPAVAIINGNQVSIVGAGTAIITASQAGNEFYLSAPEVSQTLEVTQSTSLLHSENLSANLVFPNPTSGEFILRIPMASGESTLTIVELSGKVIYETTLSGSESLISIADFIPGIYHLEIRNGNTLYHGKVVKR